MAIRALTPEQMLEGHKEWQKRFGVSDEPPEVQYLNVENLAFMYEDSPYVFDGVLYDVPPVSVPDGTKIVKLSARLESLKGKTMLEAEKELGQVFKEGIKLFKRLMHPRGVPRWVFRFVMKNPFRKMSEREFMSALAFLALCRMRSRDVTSSGVEARLPR